MTSDIGTVSPCWRKGTEIIERCLKKVAAACPSDAPFPLVGDEARLWHQAQAEAYRHALEMMGAPSAESPEFIETGEPEANNDCAL